MERGNPTSTPTRTGRPRTTRPPAPRSGRTPTGRPYLVEGVGEDFWPGAYDPTVPDEVVPITDAESFALTRRLAREEGLLVGGSSGMALGAALRVARRLEEEDPEAAARAVVVVILPDGGRGYLSKIFSDPWMRSYGFVREGDGVVVGDVLRGKSGELPALVHVHPADTVRETIDILREYGVSLMPVVTAEPPVKSGEVAGSVNERELLDAVFSGRAQLADRVDRQMGPPLPLIGVGEDLDAARTALHDSDALMVVSGGDPSVCSPATTCWGSSRAEPRRAGAAEPTRPPTALS